MLILCPECQLQVSDTAYACPHCGHPFKKIKKSPNRRRRLPNGFGQISELKGQNLRKPFRAMVTVGKDDNGRPICKLLQPDGYFSTYNDAYAALVEYNRNPYDLQQTTTMEQLYEKFIKFKSAKLSKSALDKYSLGWSFCGDLYDMPVNQIRTRHVRACLLDGHKIVNNKVVFASVNSREAIKMVLNELLDYAVEYEITDKNYARIFKVPKDVIPDRNESRVGHINFTDEEMSAIENNLQTVKYLDILYANCYMGLRPQELCIIELANVHLDEGYIVGGIKTKAGINRKIPIHSKIYPIIEKYYTDAKSLNSKYLFNSTLSYKSRTNFDYSRWYRLFNSFVKDLKLNPNHRCHDARVQFITQAKKYQVDEYAIKLIVGHEIDDITESVYTKRDISWLKAEIEKIK